MRAPGNPFVAAAAVVLALLGLLVGLRLLRQHVALHPELARKLSHLGFGLIALTFPWLFHSALPVVVVSAIAIVSLLAVRHVPALRASVGEAVHGVDRSSLGD